ncbi:type 1 glutamine amidotransferase [Rhodococcoides corynebacterioides]|uniref:Type 1 glutamine amidotransferase n=1 Tax=Rhodococcoides corynebacterioides TaxID=53972 RepID=A0ABS7P2L6_9NOCA|nr:type 1 glutamine amidotransferase [Rhodococcus corynebacterioides]MBY6365421.1 type 1 glutamine amidotransferase [Rhodococcus corynebacterioides]MBY6407925.1 type 1 glutamine amidotransferase [Rhodococcus corynebacterioides]
MRPTVLVVQPDPRVGLDRFEGWLEEADLDLEVVRPYDGDDVPPADRHGGIIVLGGYASAHDDELHPWLESIRALIRDAAVIEVPTLGICLGGQLVADALGGRVTVGDGPSEIGAVQLDLIDVDDDALFHDLGPTLLVAEHHYDRIARLPDGARLLATSDRYEHQAFRVGRAMWGVQFHPEVSPARFERWVADSRAAAPDETGRLTAAVEDLVATDAVIESGSAVLARRFADIVNGHRRIPAAATTTAGAHR